MATIHQYCNHTGTPVYLLLRTTNSTSSNGHNAEALMVAATVIMFLLGGLLFNLSLFGRLSGKAALNPTVRVFLWATFALFLPLMSYMFSEAKQADGTRHDMLPPRAQLILMWMLLVELLRKKVDAILGAMSSSSTLQGIHCQTLSGIIDQVVRIGWVGYFIYLYVHSFQLKAVFIILWLFAIVKVAQRVIAVEIAKRSFAVGKNAHLVAGYMTQMLKEGEDREVTEHEGGQSSNVKEKASVDLLKSCKYVVMGEHKVPRIAGPHGYHLRLQPETETKDLVTVGRIWRLAGDENDPLFTSHPCLKNLCLSFALFKLLRRRFENYPMDETSTSESRDLILKGLNVVNAGGTETNGDEKIEIFHVIEDELNFLGEYYHSVIPVVLSSPWFFFLNYLLVACIVAGFCIMVLVFTGNGYLIDVIVKIVTDIATISRDAIAMLKCLFHKLLNITIALFSSIDLLITLLLFLTLMYLEAWEFIVYMLSDWFMVSLLCNYVRRPRWQKMPSMHKAFGAMLWVKRLMKRSDMQFNQFSVLTLRRRSPWIFISKLVQHRFLGLASVRVPKEVKHAIVKALIAYDGTPLSIGVSISAREHNESEHDLRWACESESTTEVILVWHLATSLYELQNPLEPKEKESADHRKVATTLSKYCAYLVAFAPELLPDDPVGSERVYKDMLHHLQCALSTTGGKSSAQSQYETVIMIGGLETAAEKGAELGRYLVEDVKDVREVWKVLAKLWTEVMIYVAPSDNMEGHARALVQGGEFITVLWALVTHAGIERPKQHPSRRVQN